MSPIYMMEYSTAEKTNNMLKFTGKWLDLENTILSEVTQTQKDNIICTHSKVAFRHKLKKKPAYNPRKPGQQ